MMDMTEHLQDAAIEALAHGDSELITEEMLDHLSHCELCAGRVERAAADNDALGAMFADWAPADLEVQGLVRDALQDADRRLAAPPATELWWAAGLGTLAAALVVWFGARPQALVAELWQLGRLIRVLGAAAGTLAQQVPGGSAVWVVAACATLWLAAWPARRWLGTTAMLFSLGLFMVPTAHALDLDGTWPSPPPTVSVSVDQARASEVLRKAADSAELGLVYRLDEDPTITLHVRDVPLPSVIEAVLGEQPARAELRDGLLIIAPAAVADAAEAETPGTPQTDVPLANKTQKEEELGDAITFGQNVVVSKTQRAHDVVTMGGDAAVHGMVDGDVVTMGGDATITGRVSGSVVTTGGDIRLGVDAQVEGDLVSMGGEVVQLDAEASRKAASATGSRPQDLSRWKGHVDWDDDKERDEPETFASRALSSAARYLTVFLLGLLMLGLAPARLSSLQRIMIQSPGRSLLVGLGLPIAFVVLLVALCITIVGIPVAILLVLSAFAAVYVSLAAVASVIGAALPMESIHGRATLELAAGAGLLFLASLVPGLGTLLVTLGVLVGLGALLQVFTRPDVAAS